MQKESVKNNRAIKLQFYFMSLWLLFLLSFLLTIEIPTHCLNNEDCTYFDNLILSNLIAIIYLIMTGISWALAKLKDYTWNGTNKACHKAINIKSKDYEHLTFLTTYIIPLISLNISTIRYTFVLIVLLLIIGYIFTKTELYYGNPTLALMGYRLYTAEVNNSEKILITKDNLGSKASFTYREIDDNVWIVKEI